MTHDQRAARTGFDLAEAREANTNVWLEDWSMTLRDGAYRTQIVASEFRFDLAFKPTQSILLQGDAGYTARARSRSRRATTTVGRI